MADVVAVMPARRYKRYPDEWFDGQIRRIVPGVDVQSKALHSLQTNLIAAARKRGKVALAAIRDGAVYLQVQP
jgi:hypothetical protein